MNDNINLEFVLDEEMEYKLNFMTYCLGLNKEQVISDLIKAFCDVHNLSSIIKSKSPILFSYITDRYTNKKYKIIYVEKEYFNEKM